VNCSIKYVAQLANGLCPYLVATAVPALWRCFADQHATFSGIRVDENAAESFLDVLCEAGLDQKFRYCFA
jgi:hypothetical protein